MQATRQDIERLTATVVTFVERARKGMARAFDPTRIGILRLAADGSQPRPGDLAEAIDVNPSSITRQLQGLEEEGLVNVAKDPTDARASLVSISDSGREMLRRFDEIGVDVFSAVVADWTAEEVRELNVLLEKLLADWSARGRPRRLSSGDS